MGFTILRLVLELVMLVNRSDERAVAERARLLTLIREANDAIAREKFAGGPRA